MMSDKQELFTKKEVAKILGCGARPINRSIEQGKLRCVGKKVTRHSIEEILGHPIGEEDIRKTGKPEEEVVSPAVLEAQRKVKETKELLDLRVEETENLAKIRKLEEERGLRAKPEELKAKEKELADWEQDLQEREDALKPKMEKVERIEELEEGLIEKAKGLEAIRGWCQEVIALMTTYHTALKNSKYGGSYIAEECPLPELPEEPAGIDDFFDDEGHPVADNEDFERGEEDDTGED